MWNISPPLADFLFNLSNVLLIIGAAIVLIGTIGSIKMGSIKEHFANERVSQLTDEGVRLRERGALVENALIATGDATRASALGIDFLLKFVDELAKGSMPGLPRMPGFLSVEQHTQVVSKAKPFAGTRFTPYLTSYDLEALGLLGSIENALIEAGWVRVGPPRFNADNTIRSVVIGAYISKDEPELLNAAEAVVSALNACGVAAIVNPKTETDAINAGAIHVLVGPKP